MIASPFKWIDPSGRFSLGETAASLAASSILTSAALPAFSGFTGPKTWFSDETPTTSGGSGPGIGLCAWARRPTNKEIVDATKAWLNGISLGGGSGPDGNFIYEREADAFGHCWAACILCRRCGSFQTELAGVGRELKREWWDEPFYDEEHNSFWQDINNQEVGRERSKGDGTCGDECADAHSSGQLDLTAPITIRFWNIRSRKWQFIENRAPSLPY